MTLQAEESDVITVIEVALPFMLCLSDEILVTLAS